MTALRINENGHGKSGFNGGLWPWVGNNNMGLEGSKWRETEKEGKGRGDAIAPKLCHRIAAEMSFTL